MDKKTLKKIKMYLWIGFVILLLGSLIAERLIDIKPVAGIDGRIFFHACFGFITCMVFVIFSKLLGLFLKRNEGYYKEGGE